MSSEAVWGRRRGLPGKRSPPISNYLITLAVIMFAVAMATKRQYLGQLESITRRLLELEKEVSVLFMADGHHLRLALDDLMTQQEGAEIMGVSLRQSKTQRFIQKVLCTA